jgi:hypothetical protein
MSALAMVLCRGFAVCSSQRSQALHLLFRAA